MKRGKVVRGGSIIGLVKRPIGGGGKFQVTGADQSRGNTVRVAGRCRFKKENAS